MRDSLTAHDDLHTADSAHACARLGIYSDLMARQGRRYGTYARAAGMLQGLQALSPRQWPPLGAFIKLPALRVVHDSYSLGRLSVLPVHHARPLSQNQGVVVPLGLSLQDFTSVFPVSKTVVFETQPSLSQNTDSAIHWGLPKT